MILKQLRMMATSAAVILGGIFTPNLVSSATIATLQFATEPKRVCKGKMFYMCRLCKGNATIQWSPLYDPVAINRCLCPTYDGNRLRELLFEELVFPSLKNTLQILVDWCFFW